jgi:hypothetical protein
MDTSNFFSNNFQQKKGINRRTQSSGVSITNSKREKLDFHKGNDGQSNYSLQHQSQSCGTHISSKYEKIFGNDLKRRFASESRLYSGGRESDCRFSKPPRNDRRLFPSAKSLLESSKTTKIATECRSLYQRIQSPPTNIRISTEGFGKPEQFGECPQHKIGEHVSVHSSSNTINQSSTGQIQDRMSRGITSNPKLAGPEIRQSFGTIDRTETDFGIKRANPDRGVSNEEMHRSLFREETNIPSRGISDVPTEKQFSSFYSKTSSLLTPYILLQPEINIGKTIWHISRFYKNLIKEPSKFSLCAIAFCKELIIRVRPDLES